MAQTMLERFQETQRSDLGPLEDSELDIVVMAGLCNDLGQGVMSHLFDRQLIPQLMGSTSLKWDYKDASQMMLKYLVDENQIEIDSADLKKVCELIRGGYDQQKSLFEPKKAWLFDIVSNKSNAIDADKFDYIQRDFHSLGL